MSGGKRTPAAKATTLIRKTIRKTNSKGQSK